MQTYGRNGSNKTINHYNAANIWLYFMAITTFVVANLGQL